MPYFGERVGRHGGGQGGRHGGRPCGRHGDQHEGGHEYFCAFSHKENFAMRGFGLVFLLPVRYFTTGLKEI